MEHPAQPPVAWSRALLEQNSRWLSAYFLSTTGDMHATHDLVQEVFAKALASAHNFDPARSFGAWLRGIARNVLLVHLRNKRRDACSLDPEVLDRLEGCAEKSEGHELGGDRLNNLRECLAALTERSRSIFELKYGQDQLAKAIGARLGMSEAAVNNALARGRKLLEECIARKLHADTRMRP